MKVRSLALAGLFLVATLRAQAGTITENFATDPLQHGWQVFGNTNLFTWDSTNHVMDVTWDSTQTNSYFYLPLGRSLTKEDGFTVSFDLQLNDIVPAGFGQQVAVGLLNFFEATNATYSRPAANSPDLVEFDYFPDTGFGDSIDASLGDFTVGAPANSAFFFAYANLPLETNALGANVVCHIVLSHVPGSTSLAGQVFTNGVFYTALSQSFSGLIADFKVDTFSITSYAGDGFGDDVLAHGIVGNITVTATPPIASDTALFENFFSNPLQHGWQMYGSTNLFTWDPTNENLDVTWDSSQSNSYFYKPLQTVLSKADAFALDFDVNLTDVQWSNTFEIAAGFLNFATATDPGFSRALGYSPNIFEFNYFPDDGLGEPNVAASMADQTAITNFPDFYFVFAVKPMNPGTTFHIRMSHAAGSGMLSGAVYTNGVLYTAMDRSFPGTIGNFQLDTLSISSYSGAGQDPDFFPGSILAHGTVDNFEATLPPPAHNLACNVTNGQGQVTFTSYPGWSYTLQRSSDLATWTDASIPASGTGTAMLLSDTNTPSAMSFYRIRSTQP